MVRYPESTQKNSRNRMPNQAISLLIYFIIIALTLLVLCYSFGQYNAMDGLSNEAPVPVRFHFSKIGKGGARYVLKQGEITLTYGEVVDSLAEGHYSLISALTNAIKLFPAQGLYWECAPTTRTISSTQPFEFVILPSSSLSKISTDIKPFQEKFVEHKSNPFPSPSSVGVVAFHNLRKDAMLVVPAPRSQAEFNNPPMYYAHIAAFMHGASPDHIVEYWTAVGKAMRVEILSLNDPDQRLWLSTAGNGVSWLHIRIDTVPKYYKFGDYKRMHK